MYTARAINGSKTLNPFRVRVAHRHSRPPPPPPFLLFHFYDSSVCVILRERESER